MDPTLTESLALLLPSLAPTLATPEAVSTLEDCARLLAPIPRGGFECRLDANPQVDLQQCIVVERNEAATLREHLQQFIHPDQANHHTWKRLHDFVTQWAESSSALHQGIHEIWLEFDLAVAPATMPLPSLFLGLQQSAADPSQKIAVTEMALDLLLGHDGWASWRQNVYQCFASCPDGIFVSHLGVMLSRSAQGLRVNVKRLSPATVVPYLKAIGWQAEPDELAGLMAELYPQVDCITLCLDVGQILYPKVGLECILLQQPPDEARWHTFLTYLVARGWALPHKQEALLAWPGYTNPTTTPPPWPSHLLRASLLHPADQFTAFERRLSHIKVVYQPARPPDVKAYLWFSHLWLQPQASATTKTAELLENEANPTAALRPYQARVLDYYESTTALYVKHLGTTFQGWILNTARDVTASNLTLAERADIQPGHHLMDAGCGVCGPAIDLARAYSGLQIAALTNSPTQMRIANALLQETGLTEKVTLQLSDYHQLPWLAETFDRVIFFESSGHTEDPVALFAAVYRVLRPGGMLYIKDAFHRPVMTLSAAEQHSLAAFDQLFVYRTRTLEHTVQVLRNVGFAQVEMQDLTGLVNGLRWREAMLEQRGGLVRYTPFGKAHQANLAVWPVFCGEIKARKPKQPAHQKEQSGK